MTTLAPLANILGEHESGQDVRSENVLAVQAVANVVKSSLGPQGLDKMLVNDVGDVTVTNDGATILKLLEVKHPAARVLVDLSDLQDQEVGDGTTSVVLLAAELLKRGNQLVKQGVHPTVVIAGYKLAMKEAVAYAKNNLSVKASTLGEKILLAVAGTTLSSKFIGAETEHFARLIVDAVQLVKTTDEAGNVKYPVSAVSVLKSHGKSAKESFLVDGYALHRMTRSAEGMPRCIKNAKIALLDFNLRQHRMQFGVQIEITDPEELERVRQRERDIIKEKIKSILASGANVVFTTQGIDDISNKYFVEAGVFAVRRVDRKCIRRIARLTGGTVALTMSTLDGDEQFKSEWLGQCKLVKEERVGDWDCVFVEGCTHARAAAIMLRGANESFLDEVERSVHDALCAVSRTLECNAVVAGGGAVEAALSVYIGDFAHTLGGRSQIAVAAFAEALLVIPKTLALNSAKDCLDCLARLTKTHFEDQRRGGTAVGTKGGDKDGANADGGRKKYFGLDLLSGNVRDNLQAGVVEPSLNKIKSIRFATEAAITILRIDDTIRVRPEAPEQ